MTEPAKIPEIKVPVNPPPPSPAKKVPISKFSERIDSLPDDEKKEAIDFINFIAYLVDYYNIPSKTDDMTETLESFVESIPGDIDQFRIWQELHEFHIAPDFAEMTEKLKEIMGAGYFSLPSYFQLLDYLIMILSSKALNKIARTDFSVHLDRLKNLRRNYTPPGTPLLGISESEEEDLLTRVKKAPGPRVSPISPDRRILYVPPSKIPILLRKALVKNYKIPDMVDWNGQLDLIGERTQIVMSAKHGMSTADEVAETISNLKTLLEPDDDSVKSIVETVLHFLVLNTSGERVRGDLPITFLYKQNGIETMSQTNYSNIRACLVPTARKFARACANQTYKMLKVNKPPPFLLNRWHLPLNAAHLCFDFVDYCTILEPEELRIIDSIKKRTLGDHFEDLIAGDRVELYSTRPLLK